MDRNDYEKKLQKGHATQDAINCYTSAVYGENSVLNKTIVPNTLHKNAMVEDLSPNELLTVLTKLEIASSNVNGGYGMSQAYLQNTATYLRSYLHYMCDTIESKI